MSEVKWIHLNVDMFDNRKIRYLRKLPAGNDIVLIWVMVTTFLTRKEHEGILIDSDGVPYTLHRISEELDFDEETVHRAFEYFEYLDMISCDGNVLVVQDWKEYGYAEMADEASRGSLDYRIWRSRVILRDNFECKHCGIKLENGAVLHAHHIKAWKDHPKLRFELDNGITLCAECHKNVHRRGRGGK